MHWSSSRKVFFYSFTTCCVCARVDQLSRRELLYRVERAVTGQFDMVMETGKWNAQLVTSEEMRGLL